MLEKSKFATLTPTQRIVPLTVLVVNRVNLETRPFRASLELALGRGEAVNVGQPRKGTTVAEAWL
jgi:hypothetical protein